MALSLVAVRQRVATAISTALTASGWRESTEPYDQFGRGDGASRLHLSYAVGVPNSRTMRDGHRLDEGALSGTNVGVKWAYNLSALDQVVSYDAGLTAEQSVLNAIMVQYQSVELHLIYQESRCAVDSDGWMMGEISLRAIHYRPLS